MGENEPGHRSCSEHISIKIRSRRSKRWKILSASGEWIPDGRAWQFQGYDENELLGSLNGSLTGAQSSVQCGRNRVQKTTGFLPRTRWWINDSDLQQNWSRNEESLREVGELVWKEQTHSSLSRKQHFQRLPEPRSEINRN